MKKLCLSVLLIIAAFIILPFNIYAIDDAVNVIKLYVGEIKIISVSSPTRVVVGNPNIADVTNISKNEMTISPKSPGVTTLVYWDSFGEQSYKINVFSENLSAIKSRVDNLLRKLDLPEVYSQAEETEGKVILLGKVKTPQDRERVATILGSLKDKIVDLIQVKEEETVIDIDVQVMELTKDATSTLGLSWPDQITIGEVTSPSTVPFKAMGGLFRVLDLKRNSAYSLTLDALIQEGKAQILSRPHLACQSGKEAELIVGGEKPVFTTSVVSGGGSSTSVEYKEYGIKLKIKPVLTDDKRIKLAVNVEVSEVGEAETIGTVSSTSNQTTAKAYPLSKRTASTELYINNGQTMVIGGLNKKKEEEEIRKTPGLGNIPIIGLAFRKKLTKTGGGIGGKGDTELFITLTPTVTPEDNKEAVVINKEKAQEIKPAVLPEEKPVDPVSGYAKIVKDRILANFSYPREARENSYEGTVKISLHISYTGELLDVSIKESSGNRLLDDQAISMVKNTATYPPFPTSIESQELWIDVPVAFQLK
ncbi:MAG: TonB family protein [Candidatus Omnitrophota bacterium]